MSQQPEILASRYALLQQHQAGGMASIYKARDLIRDVLVAVKRFDRDQHLPTLEAEAYRREVEALRNLNHPNILRILDQGEDDRKRPYLVLEWMSHDLVEHRQRGSEAFNGWDDFADLVAMPLLTALAHAHANSFCHRDVKPANVLIADDGTVKLADFGISKLKRSLQPRITLNEFISRPYAPPEPDDGAHSYARDVYGFGVLCLWALSDKPLQDASDVATALETVDVIKEVRAVLARCVSSDPSSRPETAGVLAHELARIQATRTQVWAVQQRKRCRVRLTHAARLDIGQQIDQNDEGAIQRFAEQDMNDDATVDYAFANYGRPDERKISGQYYVHGGRLSYQIAADNRGGDDLVVIRAQARDPHWLLRKKAETLASPLTFDVVPRKGGIRGIEATNLLEEALSNFNLQRRKDIEEEAADELFATWGNVLDARSAYERERCPVILFSGRKIEGELVTLQVESGLEGAAPEQLRVIETDGKWIRGEVQEIIGNEVVLHCPNAELSRLPRSGKARLDTRAADIAIDRQRTALELTRTGGATRSDLRTLLLEPNKCRQPAVSEVDVPTGGLDPSQHEALKAALSTPDAILVQGPPGTGKTRFITRLVGETLARNPRARILLTSQTHVAIDNALERLAVEFPNLRILRIARPGATVVSEPCQPFVVDKQLDRWREEVASGSAAWVTDWARRHSLDPDEIATGILLKQIAVLREDVPKLRTTLQARQAEIEHAESEAVASGGPEAKVIDLESLAREADELRVQLDSGKKYLEQLEGQLRRSRLEDAEQFLQMDPPALAEWSELLVGNSDQGKRAEAVMKLQAEWLDRFGRDPSFHGALCERSSVVAATCIGLASLSGSADVTYDLCIVDEASKATATEAIVPMTRARKWVLVGDSRQLPPFEDEVHRSEELRRRFDLEEEAAGESLFERFRRLLPTECQKMLRKQYRMVPPIGRLISACFYDGEVESEERSLDAPLVSVTGRAVAWITTRYLPERGDQRDESSYVNPTEVEKILDLLGEFETAVEGVETPVKVQILSGYAAQVRLLQSFVDRSRYSMPHLSIECSTIDTVQGREADLVIFSVTRSNRDYRAGFLGELARINVALSRARETLVIVGDDEFVRRADGAEPLHRVLRHIEAHPDDCVFQSFDAPGALKGTHH